MRILAQDKARPQNWKVVLGSTWVWGIAHLSLRASLFLSYQLPLFTHGFCLLKTPPWTWPDMTAPPPIIFLFLSLLQMALVSQLPSSNFLGEEYKWPAHLKSTLLVLWYKQAVLRTGSHFSFNQPMPGRQGLWYSSCPLPPSTAVME